MILHIGIAGPENVLHMLKSYKYNNTDLDMFSEFLNTMIESFKYNALQKSLTLAIKDLRWHRLSN